MKSHQRDPIATHVTLGEKQFNGTLGLCQPIKRRRTRRINHKNRGRRSALHPPHDPEIIGANLDSRGTAVAPTQSLPWHSRTQGRDQIQTRTAAGVPTNRSIGPPSTRIGPHGSNPTRALLRRSPTSGFSRIGGLRQETRRQCGANRLKHHFSQRLTVVNRIRGLVGITQVGLTWIRG